MPRAGPAGRGAGRRSAREFEHAGLLRGAAYFHVPAARAAHGNYARSRPGGWRDECYHKRQWARRRLALPVPIWCDCRSRLCHNQHHRRCRDWRTTIKRRVCPLFDSRVVRSPGDDRCPSPRPASRASRPLSQRSAVLPDRLVLCLPSRPNPLLRPPGCRTRRRRHAHPSRRLAP